MLGKGLESLIPPQSGDDGSGSAPREPVLQARGEPPAVSNAEPPRPPVHLAGHHPHPEPPRDGYGASDENAGPAILSFDFTDEPPEAATLAVSGAAEGTAVVAPAGKELQTRRPPGRAGAGKASQPDTAADRIFHIEVSKISPNPNQPRRNFDERALWELAKSIREFGFLQPLVVTRRKVETDGGVDVEYELITGERRLLAAKMLGLERVPAIVRSVDFEREKLELAIIENVQREDLNPVERARAFQRLQEEFRLTQREIAAKLGKSRETIANTVRLLDLPMYVQEALEKGEITESHGRFLLQINDPAAQKKLFDDIAAHGLTTRDLKLRVRGEKPKKETLREAISPELKAFEEKLTMELGAPVKIEKNANTGKVVITFYSEEELENIVQKLGGGGD